MKITYSSSVEKLCEVNHSFDSGVLKVAYVGKNRNGSSISKEAFERSMSTIYNCPVVCNYNRERDEIGSHDIEVVVKDGTPTIVNITQPVGVVPESANIWWESFEDASGVHEYLCCEVLIWKRQEAYEKIKENGITDESMEIRVKSGYMEDDVFVIESFEFLAFCLLETAEPCYESAGLEMFGLTEFKQKYTEMMEEFKANFKQVNSPIGDDILKNNSKGGKEQLDQKMELLAKFGLTIEQVNFDIESMSVEEVEAELNKLKEEANKFSLTGEQFRECLIESLCAEKIETCWGEMSRYMYMDYDAEVSEVYCYDAEDWKLYGFTYSMNGDNVVVDFESKKRKKFSIVDFDEGDMDLSHKQVFDVVAEASANSTATTLNAKFEIDFAELEEKYNAASDTISEMNKEIDELRAYQQEVIAAERAADEDAVFAMFEDLNGVEAFEELRANCAEMSIEDIEEKCYALRGRQGVQKFSEKKTQNPRLPIEQMGTKPQDEPYGGLFLEFPPRN